MHQNKTNFAFKNPLTVSCFVCAAGSFGAFFRWLQNMLSFEKDTVSYLMLPTAWPLIMIMYALCVALLFVTLIRRLYKQGFTAQSDMRKAFKCRTFLLPILSWVVGGMMMIGGLVTIIGIEPTDSKELLTLVGLLAIVSGLCFPGVCTSSLRKFSPNLVFVFMLAPVLLLCVWLVYSYQVHATIPEPWVYAVEVTALSVSILAFLLNLGYPADRARVKPAMFFTMFGSFFCFMTLSDERSTGLTILMLSVALMLLMENWLIISNMRSPFDEADEAQKKKPAPRAKERTEDKVIQSGGEKAEEPTMNFDDDVKEWKSPSKKK